MKSSGLRRRPAVALLCLLVASAALVFGGARTGAQGLGAKQKPAREGAAAGAAKGALAEARVARAGGAAKANAAPKNGDAPTILGCTNTPAEQPINFGQTVNGTLAAGDCRHPVDGSFYDAYSFSGTAGQVVSIAMNSAAFDAYLYLVKPGETALSYATVQDDDGAGGTSTNSIVFAVLPVTGTYTIMANSRFPDQTGAYTLSLRSPCSATAIASGVATPGQLALNDCQLPDGSFVDVYSFSANAGQQASIAMSSPTFDTYLTLFGPDGFSVIAINDDSSDATLDSRIPPGAGLGMLPATGTYYILANSFEANTTGNYTVTLNLSGTVCTPTPIAVGQTVNGSLTGTDCRYLTDGSFLDRYTFNGTAGQQIAVTMTTSAAGLDPYLIITDAQGIEVAFADGGGGGLNARIPEVGGFFVVPATGVFTILANSAAPGMTGNYTLSVTGPVTCTYTLTPAARDNVSPGGGTFNNTFTTQASCAATVTSNVPWITVNSSNVDATGQGTFSYTVAPNTTTTARTGTITVSGQTFTVTQQAACAVSIHPTVRAFTQGGGAGRFTVIPASNACNWVAATNVPWITLPLSGAGAGTGRVNYTVAANNTGATRTGTVTVGDETHTVTQTSAATTPTVAFSNTAYAVAESEGTLSIRISVSRSGDLAAAATVDYRTVDNPAAVPCNPQNTAERGTAYARCDYATTVDTLTFNPNEASKDFLIPLVNDTHVEGNETFQIQLSNPQGATLGANTTATVTIVDDATEPANTNPVRQNDTAGFSFFVRQQYLDFLSREPDPGGFNAWLGLLQGCPNPNNFDTDPASANCDKIHVSKSFFESAEFALKGRFVFLFYKAAFARNAAGAFDPNYVPEYEEIVSDMRRVTGATAEEVFAKRLDLADDFVSRPAFAAIYGAMSNAEYVDRLLANVGATLASPDPDSGVTRNSLVADLNAGTKTRADVLRLVAEAREVNEVQFRHAYVAMQYYGYLRRKPEPGGYQNWLTYLTANPTDFRTMVNGFLNSVEYRWRFGPNV